MTSVDNAKQTLPISYSIVPPFVPMVVRANVQKRAASTHIPITLAPKRAEPVPSPTGVPTPAPTPDSTPAPPPAPTPVCIDLAPESNGTKRQRSVSPEIDGETGT